MKGADLIYIVAETWNHASCPRIQPLDSKMYEQSEYSSSHNGMSSPWADQAYLPDASAASKLNSSVAQKRIQVNKDLIIRKANENKFQPNTNRKDGLV